jgi:hypothetical protein
MLDAPFKSTLRGVGIGGKLHDEGALCGHEFQDLFLLLALSTKQEGSAREK